MHIYNRYRGITYYVMAGLCKYFSRSKRTLWEARNTTMGRLLTSFKTYSVYESVVFAEKFVLLYGASNILALCNNDLCGNIFQVAFMVVCADVLELSPVWGRDWSRRNGSIRPKSRRPSLLACGMFCLHNLSGATCGPVLLPERWSSLLWKTLCWTDQTKVFSMWWGRLSIVIFK